MEKLIKPMSGYLALVFCLLLFIGGIGLFVVGVQSNPALVIVGIVCFIAFVFFMKGLMIIQPNHAKE